MSRNRRGPRKITLQKAYVPEYYNLVNIVFNYYLFFAYNNTLK